MWMEGTNKYDQENSAISIVTTRTRHRMGFSSEYADNLTFMPPVHHTLLHNLVINYRRMIHNFESYVMPQNLVIFMPWRTCTNGSLTSLPSLLKSDL